ncbi:MAG TPA: glycosyltransferase [Acidobacteriaceae bacterium]
MHSSHLILNVIAWVIGAAWFYKLIEAARGSRTLPNLLAPEYDVAPAGIPSVAIVVPARNEADKVGECVESLLGQDYSNLRIFAVDDRSSDQTGAILDTLARANRARLEVLHVTRLPAGWLGKPHAMASAARHASATFKPDYLLFTDADIIFRADTIRRSVAQAVASQADHFIVLPTTIAKSTGEGLLLAYLQVMSLWAVRPWRVADPKAKRDAVGVGAFNLLRAAAYRQLGGFEAAPMEILEDLILGRRVKHAGLRQRVVIAPGMVRVHWAAGMLGIVNGMGKNIFAVFRFRPWPLLAATAWMALFCVAPVGFLGISGTRLPAVIALVSVAGLYVLSSRWSRLSPGYAVLFPVACVVTIYAMLRSMVITLRHGGVTWRSTFYPLDKLRSHAGKQRIEDE